MAFSQVHKFFENLNICITERQIVMIYMLCEMFLNVGSIVDIIFQVL
jgi:hypothetical protein